LSNDLALRHCVATQVVARPVEARRGEHAALPDLSRKKRPSSPNDYYVYAEANAD
jgi:hypothetical protein